MYYFIISFLLYVIIYVFTYYVLLLFLCSFSLVFVQLSNDTSYLYNKKKNQKISNKLQDRFQTFDNPHLNKLLNLSVKSSRDFLFLQGIPLESQEAMKFQRYKRQLKLETLNFGKEKEQILEFACKRQQSRKSTALDLHRMSFKSQFHLQICGLQILVKPIFSLVKYEK